MYKAYFYRKEGELITGTVHYIQQNTKHFPFVRLVAYSKCNALLWGDGQSVGILYVYAVVTSEY
jgi:hypothetical protein